MHLTKCGRWLLIFQLIFLNSIIFIATFEIQVKNSAKKLQQLKTAATLQQFFQDYCSCEQNSICRCCVRYQNNFFKVQQNLCSNLTIHRKNFEMGFNVALNDAVLFSNKFSGNNIPPLCYPLLPPWPIMGCIRAHSLRQHDDNQFHACGNATLNFAGFDLINFRIGCIDFGMRGFEFVEPDHDMFDNEPTPEISLETSDSVTEPVSSALPATTPLSTNLAIEQRSLCHENIL